MKLIRTVKKNNNNLFREKENRRQWRYIRGPSISLESQISLLQFFCCKKLLKQIILLTNNGVFSNSVCVVFVATLLIK